MGNCCPCVLKSEANNVGNQLHSSGKIEDSDALASGSSEQEVQSPVTNHETYVNGGGLEGAAAKSDSIKRPFYTLIPPLVGRGSSGDVKRTNNNTISGALNGTMGNSGSVSEVSENNLSAFYDHYRDQHQGQHPSPDGDAITADGILRLCADLDLAADDFRVLLFAWRCDAAQMGRITKQEFLHGCRLLGTDSVRSLKASLDILVKDVEDNNESFSDVYRYAFRFALDADCGQRSLPVDVAVSLWRLVFTHRPSSLLDRWIEFLEQTPPPVRAIPRDTWCMFLHLVDAVGDDLSRYDDTEAWPSLFDDFVEWANDRANQNVQQQKEEFALN